MKYDEALVKKNNILINISGLPQKILSLHGRPDVSEFVLGDLSQETCLNFKKAAFLVDNPDFDCMKGVAGYSREDNPKDNTVQWDRPEDFMERTRNSLFNIKVRNLWLPSMQLAQRSQVELVNHIAQLLEMDRPLSCSLDVKHGNHALLIFEKKDHDDVFADEFMHHGVSLLGFCPIY